MLLSKHGLTRLSVSGSRLPDTSAVSAMPASSSWKKERQGWSNFLFTPFILSFPLGLLSPYFVYLMAVCFTTPIPTLFTRMHFLLFFFSLSRTTSSRCSFILQPLDPSWDRILNLCAAFMSSYCSIDPPASVFLKEVDGFRSEKKKHSQSIQLVNNYHLQFH